MNITEEIYCPETGDQPGTCRPLPHVSMLGIIQWVMKYRPDIGRDLVKAIKDGESIFQAMNRMNREGKFQT
jgi:hypothetical protein